MDESIDLMYALLGLDESTDIDVAVNKLYERYNIDFEDFDRLALDLLKFTPIIRTVLTNSKVHAFVDFRQNPNLILMQEYV